jgi:hypothetical protein
MIYTHVMNRPDTRVTNPLDRLISTSVAVPKAMKTELKVPVVETYEEANRSTAGSQDACDSRRGGLFRATACRTMLSSAKFAGID